MGSHRATPPLGPPPAEVPDPLRAAAPLAAVGCLALLVDLLPGLPWEAGAVAAGPLLAAALVRGWQARRARARLRLAADRLLLREHGPRVPAPFAWRAAELVRRAERERLAGEVWRLLAAADPAVLPGASPLHRGAVRAEADRLEELAARLDDAAPVSARGILLARALLDDPASPLYDPVDTPSGAVVAVHTAVVDALAALDEVAA